MSEEVGLLIIGALVGAASTMIITIIERLFVLLSDERERREKRFVMHHQLQRELEETDIRSLLDCLDKVASQSLEVAIA